ncbi:MAG TPA: FAD-linked oxidase C-terminal domain-containing protein [Balneolales bacterium]|nr:FAD-linked oxidase C-terminal domain-containing protein [Balneolales bacterium]
MDLLPVDDTVKKLIHTDLLTRSLYATDASMYEEKPLGVAFPKNGKEIRELVRWASHNNIPITARSAGTSLAGQTTSSGGIVMDVSRWMTEILDIDTEQQLAHVQPGVIRDTLNREAGKSGLLLGPDTATTNRCMLGGMIGNNSTGSYSIKYGSTRDNIYEVEAILSDGTTAFFHPLSTEELEQKKQMENLEGKIYREILRLIERNRDAILKAWPHPDIIRRNTGYALDRLCTMQPFDSDGRPFNMAELLCGSEGTLAMTTSAKVKLVRKEPYSILVIPQFYSLDEAMRAAVEIVSFKPAAVELVDDIILKATKGNIEQRQNRFFLEGEPKCFLIVELDGDDREALCKRADDLKEHLAENHFGYAIPVIDDPDKMRRVWDLRKAGLGLLMGLASEEKTPTFCEDTAVRVQDLPEYVKDFQKILKKHDTNCVFYAHASVGELHLRPVINIKTEEGIRKMKAMAAEIADLVHSYKGSLSGEHGDGRARAPYIEKIIGKEMMPLLKQVKEIWDPQHIFNPGKIVDAKPIDTNLRYSPAYQPPRVDTVFHYRQEGSFAALIEQCNGAGVCRKLAESGGTMCPSYMATKEEKDSTRGRANMFRQLFSGKQQEAFSSDELNEALDLCLMCKGCKTECPANVDMARMKSEFLNGRHKQQGVPFASRFFGDPGRFYPLASQMPALTNWFNHSPLGRELFHQFAGIHPERTLPSFAHQTFEHWFENNHVPAAGDGRPEVLLFIDLFTNFNEPDIAKDAVHVLEALGYNVFATPVLESGRTAISKGLLDKAAEQARHCIDVLYPFAVNGTPIVGIEPSEILTLRDEYLDLCDDSDLDKANSIAGLSYMFEEFVSPSYRYQDSKSHPHNIGEVVHGRNQTVHVHGHCHAKALSGISSTLEVLRAGHFKPVDLKTGCCGMAGSFGYEENHYDVSMKVGELVLFPALREAEKDDLICAPGFSCRHQIDEGVHRTAKHPASILAEALRPNPT